MKLPDTDTSSLALRKTYKDILPIPDSITFTPPTEETITEFRSLVDLYNQDKATGYAKVHKTYKHYVLQNRLGFTSDIAGAAHFIENDYTSKTSYPTINNDMWPIYTETLLLKLCTMDLDYPLLLALCFVTPQKEYTYEEFSAAYYVYCLKRGLPGIQDNHSMPKDYRIWETERASYYKMNAPILESQIPDTVPPLTPYESTLGDFNYSYLDKPPLPPYLHSYRLNDGFNIPFFVFTRDNIEFYFVTPMDPKTGNKLFKLYETNHQNNLLKHTTFEEDTYLNLSQSINQLNFPLTIRMYQRQLFPLPEIVDINVLLNQPPTGKKADMFIMYPLLRRD